MTRLKKIGLSGVAAATLAFGAIFAGTESASADAITQTATETNASTFTYDFTFNGFNTSLGTLTSITLTLMIDETPVEEIINIDSASHNYSNATASFPITAEIMAPGSTTTMVTLTATAGPFTGTAAPGTTDNPGSADTGSQSTNVAMSDWIFYEGSTVVVTGLLTAQNGSYGGSETDGQGKLFFGGDLSGSSTATLVYNYTPDSVPEPLTLSLFGAGLVGAAGMSRRRKANKTA
jgi:PEP-CTERM motif